MKKILTLIVLVLAINFLAVAGGIGYLSQAGNVDKAKIAAIKGILFPSTQPNAPATQPIVIDPTTRPALQLELLLAKQSGRNTAQQIEFIRQSFDSQTAELDRRYRELTALQGTVAQAQQKLTADRVALAVEQKVLADREQLASKLATDEGFQDSLALYTTMAPKQVKPIFSGLSDETIVRYLQAMEPKVANKILKEFKAPDEIERVKKLIEMVRLATPPDAAVAAVSQEK